MFLFVISFFVFFLVFLGSFHLHMYLDTYWFTITLGCVCFKETHNYTSITSHLPICLRMYESDQSYQDFFTNSLFFNISFSTNISVSAVDTIIGLKNTSSNSLLIFISLSLSSLCLNSSKLFSISKSYYLHLKLFFLDNNYLVSVFSFL